MAVGLLLCLGKGGGTVITKNEIVLTIAAVLAFAGGFALRGVLHTCPVADTKGVTQVEYRDKVKTEIAYVPKETVIYKSADGSTKSEPEKTDIGAGVSKDGAVGIISFQLKGNAGGWVAGRADNVMGGVMVRF